MTQATRPPLVLRPTGTPAECPECGYDTKVNQWGKMPRHNVRRVRRGGIYATADPCAGSGTFCLEAT